MINTKRAISPVKIQPGTEVPDRGDSMRKYGGLILMSTLLLASCSPPTVVEPKPELKPMMQLAAGTFSGQGASTTGTALLVKLTLSDGSAVTQDTQVTVTGPKGWNKDEPLDLTVDARGYIDWLVTGFIPAVAGVYQASVSIAGQTYTAASGPVSVTNLLDAPNPVTISDDGTQVRVTWPSVGGAVVYSSRIVKGGETVAGTYIFTRTIPAVYASTLLAPNTDYTASVLAFNAALDTEKTLSVPTQFNASRATPTVPFSRLP